MGYSALMAFRAQDAVAVADKIVNKIIVLIFVIIFTVSSYVVYDSIRIRNEVRAADKVADSLNKLNLQERISYLHSINPDVIGWIKLDGTKIEHPILQAADNDFYLTHDYKKEYSLSGSIFVDYRNKVGDDYYVYYGHNIDGGTMLGRINEYSEKEFFDNHLSGTLYYEDGSEHSFDVIAFSYRNEQDKAIYSIDENARGKNRQIYDDLVNTATHINPSASAEYSKLILLSTCTKTNGERAVLLLGYND